MMTFKFPEGSTLLEPDELTDLIPSHITTQQELNEWEEQNIILAQQWALNQNDILSLFFMRRLHLHMFNLTWKWAGEFRSSEKNLGVTWHAIPTEIKVLCDNIEYQLVNKVYPIEEIAARFHHRLVWIHPFPNGNGRHARLMTDLLLIQHGHSRFSWGMGQDLHRFTVARKNYIAALKSADKGDFTKLFEFVGS